MIGAKLWKGQPQCSAYFKSTKAFVFPITTVAALQLHSHSICSIVVNIILLNTQNSPEEEAELKKLKDLEKSVEQIANKLEEVNKEFTSIQKVCQLCVLFCLCKIVLQVYI